MRAGHRRALFAAPLFAASLLLAWSGLGHVPLRLPGKHGLPGIRFTGESRDVFGMTFVGISPGYVPLRDPAGAELLPRTNAVLGLAAPVPDRLPVQWVEFENGLWIASTEVTNEQFLRFWRRKWSGISESRPPREPALVPAPDAKLFCRDASDASNCEIRLLSEAEWRAVAGAYIEIFVQDGRPAWLSGDSNAGPLHEVATAGPSSVGLHDFFGNAWEWCSDAVYPPPRYENLRTDNDEGSSPVRGGGTWLPRGQPPWRPRFMVRLSGELAFRPVIAPSSGEKNSR